VQWLDEQAKKEPLEKLWCSVCGTNLSGAEPPEDEKKEAGK
jgi:hypothetical protein